MEKTLSNIIQDQTNRALWELKNIIDCIPKELWQKNYCGMPLYKHIYHTLHSLDLWFINPNDKNYTEPFLHIPNLNNLDIVTDRKISNEEILVYYFSIKKKITKYTSNLTDSKLYEIPQNCKYNKFNLIIAQFRHLHTHMGMIMGWIIESTGNWPAVLGLEKPIPADDNYEKFC